MFKLQRSKLFERGFKKLKFEEQRAVVKKLNIMAENPFHPSLRTKKLKRLTGVFECSVNMSLRILWKYENGRIILLLNVGRHDIL